MDPKKKLITSPDTMQSKVEEFFDIVEKIASTTGSMPRFQASSKLIKPGDIFVAFKGKNTDGHLFADDALKQGASFCVVSDPSMAKKDGFFCVDDTLEFIQHAASVRLTMIQPYTIGITGSCGKTTTKQFLYTLLKQRFPTFATFGNFNSRIGLPLSVLSMPQDTKYAILEMGMSRKGDISDLRKLFNINASIVTSIGLAHAENFPDLDQGIASAKAEIMEGVTLNIFHEKTDQYAPFLGCLNKYVVDTKRIKKTQEGIFFELEKKTYGPFKLKFDAPYLLENLCLVLALCQKLGLDLNEMKSEIEALNTEAGRLEFKVINGIRFIDDSYNASPSSMKNALDYFLGLEGNRKFAVIGAMRELGEVSEGAHMELYNPLSSGLQHVFCIGEETLPLASKLKQKASYFENLETLVHYLKNTLKKDDFVLIKGSHSTGLHELVKRLS